MNTNNNIIPNDPLEQLRNHWRQLRVDTDGLDEANRVLSETLATKKVNSMQEQLAGRMRRIAWLGLAFPPMAMMMYYELSMPLWLCVMYVAVGLLMAVLNRMLGDYVAEERLMDLPVADAIRRATYIRVRQQQLRVAGMVAGAVVIGFLLAEIIDTGNDIALLGAIVGMAVGLAIGIPRCIRNARLARKLVESLS